MISSISSSEAAWRRFATALLLAACVPGVVVYLFIVLVDPWGMLPVHLPLARVPISTNARFSFPALAVSPRFDSVIVGTSTSRLLRPAMLDGPFGARFANLAMNSATAWEQDEILSLFARSHPDARAVIVGLDAAWCQAGPGSPRLTGRAFPVWMYQGAGALGFLHMFSLYALQEAFNQLAASIGIKRSRYGSDGYTNFLPPDRAYDRGRVDALFARWGSVSRAPPARSPLLPYVEGLGSLLSTLPAASVKILFFPPITVETMGVPGSGVRAAWDACKRDAALVASKVPNARVMDFALDNAIDRSRENFWDPIHYRVAIANSVMRSLGQSVQGSNRPRSVPRTPPP